MAWGGWSKCQWVNLAGARQWQGRVRFASGCGPVEAGWRATVSVFGCESRRGGCQAWLPLSPRSCCPPVSMSRRRVSYYYDREWYSKHLVPGLTRPPADVGCYSFGITHPMKPQRMRITHELLTAYDMLPKMRVLVSSPLTCT